MTQCDRGPRPAGGQQPLRAQAARAHLTALRGLPPILESFGVACEPILKTAKLNIMRQLCGPAWRPDAVLLPRRRPADIRPYRDHFMAPLRFDSMLAAIVFPEYCLNQPIVDADPLLRSLLADNASSAIARRDPVVHSDVRRAIRLLLLPRQCSRAEVARRLGLHERALGRRLQATGTTFQRLLDDTREEIARQLLCDTDIPVARVATALGYGDATVFTRAFSRWTGLTPSEFRARLSR